MAAEPARFETINSQHLIVADSLSLPPLSVGNTQIKEGSTNRIAASKVIHPRVIQIDKYGLSTDTVAALDQIVYVAHAAATIKAFYARVITAPTGGDLTYTCDLKSAADASSSFSSVLSTTIPAGSTDNAKVSGVVGTPALAAGSALQAVITLSGSTGTQGLGLLLVLVVEETTT